MLNDYFSPFVAVPGPPVDFQAKSLGSNAMELWWLEPSHGNPMGYIIAYNSTGQHGVVLDDLFVSTHTFHDLTPATFYKFTIVAFNSFGNSTPESIIEKTDDLGTVK